MAGLKGKRVGVFGLGKSGLAAARLLLREGAHVVALDERAERGESPEVRALARSADVTLRLGPAPLNTVAPDTVALDLWERSPDRDGLCLLVVSPGVPLSSPSIAAARAAGVEVIGEIELAFRHLPPQPVIAITGTNGKSTTTALVGEMFRQAGRRTFVGGNLGLPLSEAALAPEPYDAYVVELSSFQLEGNDTFRANGAAILNLTPDHLDRYPDHAAYGAAKARIFRNQGPGDFAVVNADDPEVVQLARGARVPVAAFGMRGSRGQETAPTGQGVSGQGPKGQGEAGTTGQEGAGQGSRGPGGSGERLTGPVAVGEGNNFHVGPDRFEVTSRALRGAHNLQNAMAAALLARQAGLPDDAIARALETFPGLAHRLESVRILAGVEWVNDSKATNVDSALVALRAFSGGPRANVWLIAGGKGKGAPYAPLVEAGRGVLKGVLTIGKDSPLLQTAFENVTPVHTCETIQNAVRRARELAVTGDVVLLSPACASYDQFQNFEDRGDTFKRLVRELPE